MITFMVVKLRILNPEKILGFEQVRGRDCKGISGALVEVWYAGGKPGCVKVFLDPRGPLGMPSLVRKKNSRNLSQSP